MSRPAICRGCGAILPDGAVIRSAAKKFAKYKNEKFAIVVFCSNECEMAEESGFFRGVEKDLATWVR